MANEARAHERGRSTSTRAEPERFFFVHLQRTAGASLAQMLRQYFGIDAVYPNRHDGNDVPVSMVQVPHLLERWNARKHEIRVVAGHFPLSTTELLDARFRTLTLLREPVERTLSFLRFHKKITPEDRHLSLDVVYEDPFRLNGFIRNHMVKMFSLAADEMRAGAITYVKFTPELLERAKQNLASVDVVGLQERFEEFGDALRETFGWDLGEPIHVNHTAPEEASQQLRDRIARDNAMDIELYEFARELCSQRHGARTSRRP